MELKDYCDRVRTDLTNWKAKTYDLVQETNRMKPASRDRIAESIKDLHGIIATIEKEIRRLETECPVEWEAEREAMKAKFKELDDNSEKVWRDLSPDDYE